MTQDMNTIYGQDLWNYGAGALRNCGEGFGGRKTVAAPRKYFSRFLRFAAVLLLMIVGMSGVKAQKDTDYSGTYYIASDAIVSNKRIYDEDHTKNYYLCPTENWISFGSSGTNMDTWTTGDDKPFLTTYMINAHDDYDKSKAKWTIEFYTTENEKDYYYIKHSSGKYLVLNKQINGASGNNKHLRIRVHLESLTQTDLENETTRNNALFSISRDGRSYVIDPKTQPTFYLTVNKGNGDYLQGENRNSGGNVSTYYLAGTIGIYQGDVDATKYFYLEEVVPRPTFTNTSSQIDINHSEENTTIYYTTDGTNPTTTHYNGQGPAPLQIDMLENSATIKAIAAGTDHLPSCISKIRVVPSASITLASSTLTYNGEEQSPTVSIVKDGETEIPSSEYTVSYSNNINAGENTAVVTITDKDGGDYIVYGSGSFTINPASVTLTANSRNTDVYDGTEKTATGFTCKKGEQTMEGLTFTGVRASGSGTDAGDYDVTFTGVTVNTTKDATGNYVVTGTTNGKLTINRKAVTITAKSKSKTYDGTALTESGFEATALETSDEHTFNVTMTAESTITNAGTQPNVIASVDGVAMTTGTATNVGNYKVTTANGTLTINKKDVTISGIIAENKVYDGNTTATLVYTNVALNGKIGSDDLTVSATGAFADKKVDTGKTVTISGLTLGGTAASNYVLAATGQQESATADITVKEVTASGTITANNKEYDGTTTAELDYTNVTLTGKVDGDDLTVSATGVYANKDVGTGKTVNISGWILDGTDKDNYIMASTGQPTTTTADITRANITVSGITAKNKVFDGNTTATLVYTNVTLTGKVEGETLTITATGAFDNKNVGTDKTVNITDLALGGSDVGNYALAATGQQTTATADITAKEITVSGITASNKEYDGNTTATLVYTGVTFTGKLDGDNLTVTATGAFTDKNVGTDKTVDISGITLDGTDIDNYQLATSGQQETTKANITTATATVTADDKTKGYGDSDPTFTATVTGLKNNEEASILTFTFSRAEGEDVNASGYTITPTGNAEQGNYTVTYETGTLTITAKDIGNGTTPAEGIDIDIAYNGSVYTVTVKQGENTLASTNYTWSGADDQDHPENYVVTVEGQGNYTNSAKATYTKVTFYDTTPDDNTTTETAAVYYNATQNLQVGNDFAAYYVTNLENDVLTITKVEAGEGKKNYIPANQPVLLISETTPVPKGFTLKSYTGTDVVNIPASGEGANLLKVVTDEGGLAVDLAQMYIFSMGEFVLSMAGTMSKGKFYLENPNYSTSAPSRQILHIKRWESTGIDNIQFSDTDSQHSDIWYTIGGQKLNKKPTRKGLYLQNGQKVVIK